jgi:hypothetical protein
MTIQTNTSSLQSWSQLFATLSLAERAAGVQMTRLSAELDERGQHALAEDYSRFAEEEFSHERAVASLCRGEAAVDARTRSVYDGERTLIRDEHWVAEILGLIHLVFEPAGMAFYSQILSLSRDLFSEEESRLVRATLGPILREEAGHISAGRELFFHQFESRPIETKRRIRRSVKLHRAFVTMGLRSLFEGWTRASWSEPEHEQICEAMVSRFEIISSRVAQGRLM